MRKARIGLMGFGEIPRHIYRLCTVRDDIEIVAIGEIGKPEILQYLVKVEAKGRVDVKLDGNFLVSKNGRTRMVYGGNPGDIPWDMFDVDFVVDGTWKYNRRADMLKHINAGAPRVIISSLPSDEIDRIVIIGVNEDQMKTTDRMVSAGSATSNATSVMLKILDENFGVDYAMLTTVHSYTSAQPLRDKAGEDYRRSRSAAENIIPMDAPTPGWIGSILPSFAGRVEGSAINVPVPNGSVLDLTTIFKTADFNLEDVHKAIEREAVKVPRIIEVTNEPVVSTDIIGNTHSVVYDRLAMMKSAHRMIKTLTWYHAALVMASRIIDVILAYQKLNSKGGGDESGN